MAVILGMVWSLGISSAYLDSILLGLEITISDNMQICTHNVQRPTIYLKAWMLWYKYGVISSLPIIRFSLTLPVYLICNVIFSVWTWGYFECPFNSILGKLHSKVNWDIPFSSIWFQSYFIQSWCSASKFIGLYNVVKLKGIHIIG